MVVIIVQLAWSIQDHLVWLARRVVVLVVVVLSGSASLIETNRSECLPCHKEMRPTMRRGKLAGVV